MFALRSLLLISAVTLLASARADGPKDNIADSVRPIPPAGVEVPKEQLAKLEDGIAKFREQLTALKASLAKKDPKLPDLTPDVEIFLRAVEQAVHHKEFFNSKEAIAAEKLLDIGMQRLKELSEGKPSWTTATGPVVRGYRSKIDDTVQPYGIAVPATFARDDKTPRRLDFWWHGRGETLSENNFITGVLKSTGTFPLEDGFVLQPYGRYSNANKFAGEVDTFECLEHAKKHYPIDDNRLVARGFSMGGAACWQFATHFPTLWCAANPGAGFAETPEFLNFYQSEKVEPTWYEKKLWHLYNATDYAQNIFNLPTVAYSGEIDKQKQAADVMAREMKKVGLELTHIIGPKTAHAYEKGAKVEVAKRIDEIASKGKDTLPKEIKFVTYTLKYNQCGPITILGMKKHWEPARVFMTVENGMTKVKTENVTWLGFPKGTGLVNLDGVIVPLSDDGVNKSMVMARKDEQYGTWRSYYPITAPLVKQPGLQGPIDDAFMSRFVMVSPTGTSSNPAVEKFVQGEMKHAVDHWRKHFRGDAIVKKDSEVSEDDIKNASLVLWGDPSSNAVLAKIADKLPIKWTKDGVTIGDKTYPAGTHVPVMIFPNPLNPKKYVVLNSGFTFREYAYLNNARQVPMLPDYAIVDITTPPSSRYPGKIVQAGFFGEKWELLPKDGQ